VLIQRDHTLSGFIENLDEGDPELVDLRRPAARPG
jgi:hypothetical protein